MKVLGAVRQKSKLPVKLRLDWAGMQPLLNTTNASGVRNPQPGFDLSFGSVCACPNLHMSRFRDGVAGGDPPFLSAGVNVRNPGNSSPVSRGVEGVSVR